jgi:hypothetical protein
MDWIMDSSGGVKGTYADAMVEVTSYLLIV